MLRPQGQLLVLAVAVATPTPMLRADWIGEEQTRLAQGQVLVSTEAVVGSDVPVYVARAVVDAPPARVWEIVSDCGRYHETLVRVASSSVVSRDGDVVICRMTMDMPFPLPNLTTLARAVHQAEGGRFTRTWRQVEGDFAFHEGSWTLEPFGDGTRTLVVYRARVQPKLPVPEAWLAATKKTALTDTLAGLRQRFASH